MSAAVIAVLAKTPKCGAPLGSLSRTIIFLQVLLPVLLLGL